MFKPRQRATEQGDIGKKHINKDMPNYCLIPQSRYNGMRDPWEYNTKMLKKLFIYGLKDSRRDVPKHNRWRSRIGKIVCSRVFFSSDLRPWFIKSYRPEHREFRNHEGKSVFSSDVDKFRRVFRLKDGGKPIHLPALAAVTFVVAQNDRYKGMFRDGQKLLVQRQFPLNYNSLSP